jgi:deoxyribodipyrimidine photo-lyase
MSAAVVLFTRDLRLADNPALSAAVRDFDKVLPLFVFDPRLLSRSHASPNRLAFLLDCLGDLDRSLGGGLITRTGDPVIEALRVAAQAGATTIEVARDASAYARRRIARLQRGGAAAGIRVRTHPGSGVVEPGALVPAGRDHFAVFTPYYRRWLTTPRRPLQPRPTVHQPTARLESCPWPDRPHDLSPNLPTGGESAGRERLDGWLSSGLASYSLAAEDLGADATSRLSPYLHFGCVSAVETAHRSQTAGGPGVQAFVRQLCWRDFHMQVLAAQPALATVDYRPRGDRWQHDPAGLARWKAGRTGIPLVDAAMRQLVSEGWIPNRARLVAASFLVKDLYIDWRLGFDHFTWWLVDGDLASNAGNWQWVAGTGNDSRPNRVLNPERQAVRFDPTGAYVERHLPEIGTADYPHPMVDHRQAAARFHDSRRHINS